MVAIYARSTARATPRRLLRKAEGPASEVYRIKDLNGVAIVVLKTQAAMRFGWQWRYLADEAFQHWNGIDKRAVIGRPSF